LKPFSAQPVVYIVATSNPGDKMGKGFLGEFEQMILLAVLQQGDSAFGLEVRREIERSANRKVSRSGFYTTVDRLVKKGYLEWTKGAPQDPKRTATVRKFSVTPAGMNALRTSQRALKALTRGLDHLLEEA
jgi:DNA-binding PadR family transcriptional regulator